MKLLIYAFTLLPILTYAAPIGTTPRQQLARRSQVAQAPARATQHYARQRIPTEPIEPADTNPQQQPSDEDSEDSEDLPGNEQGKVTTTTMTVTKQVEVEPPKTPDVQVPDLKGGQGEIRQQEVVVEPTTTTTPGSDAEAPFTTVICQPCPPNTVCKAECVPYTVTITPNADAAVVTPDLAIIDRKAEANVNKGAKGGGVKGGAGGGEEAGAKAGFKGGAEGADGVEEGDTPTPTLPEEEEEPVNGKAGGVGGAGGAGGAGPADDD